MRRLASFRWRWVAWMAQAAAALAVLLALLVLWPARWGGTATLAVVQGRSMEPVYHSGDLVVARRHGQYHVGDIVVFHARFGTGSALVVHRIIAIGAGGTLITKGDNRATPDTFETTMADVEGEAQWMVPRGARALGLLSRWWMLGILSGLLVLVNLWPGRDAPTRPGPPEAAST